MKLRGVAGPRCVNHLPQQPQGKLFPKWSKLPTAEYIKILSIQTDGIWAVRGFAATLIGHAHPPSGSMPKSRPPSALT